MLKFPTVQKNLDGYINAKFPILYIRTFEEAKTDAFIKELADAREGELLGVLEWNAANGFVDFKNKSTLIADQTLEATLKTQSLGKELHRRWLIIKDADEYLRNEPSGSNPAGITVVARLKEIARKINAGMIDATVIIVSSVLHIPKPLEKVITVMELDFPDEIEREAIVKEFIEENALPTINPKLLEDMVLAFKGMTESEIENLLKLAVAEDGDLTADDLKLIFEQKKQMIMKAGILEMVELKEDISKIGGLENLKNWLNKKAKIFGDIKRAEEFGVVMPKGVLIAGMPGCGKSLTAKAAGKLFDVPLIKLDMGRLMGRYVGESEENMRRAIQLAEAISPCVLWVDELEKAFAGIGGGGSEVTTRLFGTFLTWMQEKTDPVFVLATANKIVDDNGNPILPPELLRKGRFDEIFYVKLPNPVEREKIFEIHIDKRKQKIDGINIKKLVSETDGYTGADIEGVVAESVESVFVKNGTVLTIEDVLECIKNTHPLSEIMDLDKMAKAYEEKKFKKASL